jgi:hypothetical protein
MYEEEEEEEAAAEDEAAEAEAQAEEQEQEQEETVEQEEGRGSAGGSEQPAAGEASPWIAKTDDEGDVYYVNTRTQQIQARWPRHKRATMHHTLYTVYRTP